MPRHPFTNYDALDGPFLVIFFFLGYGVLGWIALCLLHAAARFLWQLITA